MKKELYIGANVSFKDEEGGGVIRSIHKDGSILVEGDDGFEMPYERDELILIEKEDQQAYEKSFKSSFTNKDAVSRQRKPVKHKRDEVEVDLHIEELTDNYRGWSNAEIIQFQLEKFESVLNSAFQTRKRKMIVIHGRGDGVLRYEIRRKLQDYPGVEVHDANFKIYGQGATEILLHK